MNKFKIGDRVWYGDYTPIELSVGIPPKPVKGSRGIINEVNKVEDGIYTYGIKFPNHGDFTYLYDDGIYLELDKEYYYGL